MTIVRRAWIGDLEITAYPYGLEFGADFGSPDAEVVTLESLLADGQVESLTRRMNRGMSVSVIVEGSDLREVQDNEAALVLECDRRQNTLTIDLGDDFAEPMVFETTVIEPKRVTGTGSDEADMANLHRWSLSVKAQPFWRSATKVIDDAGTPPASGVVVYGCESTTGWSTAYSSSFSGEYVADTSIKAQGSASVRSRCQYYRNDTTPTSSTCWDKVTGLSIDTGTGGYMSVRIRPEWTLTVLHIFMTTASSGRSEVASPIATGRDANGFVRYAWLVDAGLTVTALEFQVSQDGPAIASLDSTTNPPHHVWYDDVELSTAATTEHQIVKQHQVQGSARTPASLHIAAPDDSVALGNVLAITVPTDEVPAGFQPDGRRWITQGTTTADASALGGSYLTPDAATYSTASGKPIFDAPVGMLTAGPYVAVGLVKAEASSLTFGVQAQLLVGSSTVGPVSAAETSPKGLSAGWQFVTAGTVFLPPLPVQNAVATTKVRLLFKGAKMAEVFLIPAWQVGGRSVADFSIVDCGSGTVAAGGASSNLWIDSPSTSQPQGGWWRGPSSDRANAQSAWPDAKKPGVHTFRPGQVTAFVVSTGAAGPLSILEYFPAYL